MSTGNNIETVMFHKDRYQKMFDKHGSDFFDYGTVYKQVPANVFQEFLKELAKSAGPNIEWGSDGEGWFDISADKCNILSVRNSY